MCIGFDSNLYICFEFIAVCVYAHAHTYQCHKCLNSLRCVCVCVCVSMCVCVSVCVCVCMQTSVIHV